MLYEESIPTTPGRYTVNLPEDASIVSVVGGYHEDVSLVANNMSMAKEATLKLTTSVTNELYVLYESKEQIDIRTFAFQVVSSLPYRPVEGEIPIYLGSANMGHWTYVHVFHIVKKTDESIHL
jgi:hypothetical protein